MTLQKPTGRIAIPFSSNRKAPQDPAPVSTGERMAVRLSSPLPRWIITPGTRFSTSELCVAPVSTMSPAPTRAMLSGVSRARTCLRARRHDDFLEPGGGRRLGGPGRGERQQADQAKGRANVLGSGEWIAHGSHMSRGR